MVKGGTNMSEKIASQENEFSEEKNQGEEVRGYHETMYVTKSGLGDATSGSTGSLTGYAYYSAACTEGLIFAKVQYYNNNTQEYKTIHSATRTLTSGSSFSGESVNEPGAVMLRLVLSGPGLGNGSIQGYN